MAAAILRLRQAAIPQALDALPGDAAAQYDGGPTSCRGPSSLSAPGRDGTCYSRTRTPTSTRVSAGVGARETVAFGWLVFRPWLSFPAAAA